MFLLPLKNTALAAIAISVLSACSPLEPMSHFDSSDPVFPMSKAERSLNQAHFDKLEQQLNDIKSGALSRAENHYKKNPKDPGAALKYAALLRKVGFVEQAKMVLKPFAVDSKKASEDILVEYAKLNLESGDFDTAQIFAQEASFVNRSAKSSMILGIALGSQGHFEASERNFRNALDNVGLDIQLRAKILNNLAINLILQERLGEAQEVMSMVDTAIFDSNTLNRFEANKALLRGV